MHTHTHAHTYAYVPLARLEVALGVDHEDMHTCTHRRMHTYAYVYAYLEVALGVDHEVLGLKVTEYDFALAEVLEDQGYAGNIKPRGRLGQCVDLLDVACVRIKGAPTNRLDGDVRSFRQKHLTIDTWVRY